MSPTWGSTQSLLSFHLIKHHGLISKNLLITLLFTDCKTKRNTDLLAFSLVFDEHNLDFTGILLLPLWHQSTIDFNNTKLSLIFTLRRQLDYMFQIYGYYRTHIVSFWGVGGMKETEKEDRIVKGFTPTCLCKISFPVFKSLQKLNFANKDLVVFWIISGEIDFT